MPVSHTCYMLGKEKMISLFLKWSLQRWRWGLRPFSQLLPSNLTLVHQRGNKTEIRWNQLAVKFGLGEVCNCIQPFCDNALIILKSVVLCCKYDANLFVSTSDVWCCIGARGSAATGWLHRIHTSDTILSNTYWTRSKWRKFLIYNLVRRCYACLTKSW